MVVTTAGYNDRTTLDLAGHPHTEALRMTERFHRRDAGHLESPDDARRSQDVHQVVDASMEFDLMPDGELIEYVCDNERDGCTLVGKSGEEFRVPAEIWLNTPAPTGAAESARSVSLEGNHLMINPGPGKIPLVAHAENNFTMEGTGVEFVRMQRRSHRNDPALDEAIGTTFARNRKVKQVCPYRATSRAQRR